MAVIDQGALEGRLTARLALARIYADDGELTSAVRQLDTYLLEAPSDVDVRAAQFSLAEALALQGDWQGALPLYDAYIQSGGGATTYARLGRADALLRLGRFPAAVAEAERALSEALPPSVQRAFLLNMAQQLEETHPEDALVFYDRLGEESSSPADQALALWRSALIRTDQGNTSALPDAWTTIIQRFPETATARSIVDEPPPLVVQLDRYYLGLVYRRDGRSDEARQAFQASIETNQTDGDLSLAARASYYLATLDERAGNTSDAIAGYGRAVDLDSTVEIADDALWNQAHLLEEAGRASEGTAGYERLIAEYPGSEHAADARFLLAFEPYERGRFQEAAEALGDVAEATEGHERQRALLWQGKALTASGDEDAAETVWRSLREEAPDDFSGLRAAVLLGEAGDALEDAGLDQPITPDWAAIETWLRDTTGEDPSVALETLLYDQHWGLGQELLALGMRRRASVEFRMVLDAAEGDAAALYQTARFFHSAGVADLSARAATRLLSEVPDEASDEAPADLLRLAYPAPFVQVVRESADESGTPDLLLLAMTRQESFFDPLAGSSAGALGLTQVISSTAEEIASNLGASDFETQDLYRPAVSLRFGAYYLGQQLNAFDGSFYFALAAYNAGPGNAQRWVDASGGDVDRFVEEISFSETKSYVHLVTEYLARYRQLYQGADEPSLPPD